MTGKELKTAVAAIRPTITLREVIAGKPVFRQRRNSAKKVVLMVASFFLVVSLALGIPFWVGQGGEAFSGFSIQLAADDGSLTALEPEVTMPLGSYSMLMSSVPGFPFCIELKGSDSNQVHVDADRGELLTWGADGVVTGHGGSGSFTAGTPLYWSPLNKDQSIADGAVITLSAHLQSRVIPLGQLEITAEDDTSFYFITYHQN